MTETWKDIPGYPGYQISDCGRVRTYNKVTSSARFPHRKWKPRILSQKDHAKDGYLRIDLWQGKEHHTHLVHRLVAIAFLGDREGMTVNHKDGNKKNNHLSNLEWMTLRDNIRYGFTNGQYSKVQIPCSLVIDGTQIDFPSLAAAKRYLGRAISSEMKGERIYDRAGREVYII